MLANGTKKMQKVGEGKAGAFASEMGHKLYLIGSTGSLTPLMQ